MRASNLGENFQIIDRAANRNPELVGENDTTKVQSDPLPPGRLGQQVLILAHEHAAKLRGSVEKFRVFQARRPIDLGGQHVHIAQDQTPRDSRRYMHVHVEADAHASLPISRNRFRIGDSPACARNRSTSCELC